MQWLAMLVPALLAVFLVYRYASEIVWWEIAALLGLSALAVGLTTTAMIRMSTTDVEYFGSYTVAAEYEEPWDEWITQTCTRSCCCTTSTDAQGRTTETCGTETYDCSYRRYHPAEWHKVDNLGRRYEISEAEYLALGKQFGARPRFEELNRDFYHEDGDAYWVDYAGPRARMDCLTRPHDYENKVRVSPGVFHLREVGPDEIKAYHPYEYPQVSGGGEYQPAVLSTRRLPMAQVHPYDEINAILGARKQVRLFVLLFEDLPRQAARVQENYWEGGNKNELVVCLGVHQGRVQWAETFAWEDNPKAEIRIRDLFLHQPALDLTGAAPQVERIIEQDWHRKPFADFAYLEVELTPGQLMGLFVLILCLSAGVAFWAVNNQYRPEDPNAAPRDWMTHGRRPVPGKRRF